MSILNTEYKGAILIALGFLLLNLIGLDRSPVVWMDEVTLNDPAKELALRGRMVSSVFADRSGFEEAYYWQPPGQPLIMALVYKVFGFGIWQTRIPGVLFGSGTLVVLYILSKLVFQGNKGALLSAVILGLDPRFIESARSGRMDTQTLFFAVLGVLFFLGLMQGDDVIRPRRRGIFLSGVCLGLAGLSHPLAIVWLAALGVIVVGLRQRSHLITFLKVSALAAAPTVLWIMSAAAAGNMQLLRIQFLGHGSSRLSAGDVLSRIIEEVLRYLAEYRFVPGLLALYVTGLAWVLWQRGRFRRVAMWLAIVSVVMALLNAFFMAKNIGFYFLHPVTILAIMAGAMTAVLWEGGFISNGGRTVTLVFRSALIMVLANVLVAGIIGRYSALVYQWGERDYRQVAFAISEIVPADSVVWGPPDIWYAVEQADASLRIRGEPDRGRHDFLVTKVTGSTVLPTGIRKVGEFGAALPPVFGVIQLQSTDYRMQVWEWTHR